MNLHHFELLQVTALLDREQFLKWQLLQHEVCEHQHLQLHGSDEHLVHSWRGFVRAQTLLAAKCQ